MVTFTAVNIRENCDNFTTSVEFVTALQAQLAEVTGLREDVKARGWDAEVARHARVSTSLSRRLERHPSNKYSPAT